MYRAALERSGAVADNTELKALLDAIGKLLSHTEMHALLCSTFAGLHLIHVCSVTSL
jgi:hypothetical protein